MVTTFDPTQILRPCDDVPTRRQLSPLFQTLAYVAESHHHAVELHDLIGYSANTWHREAVRAGLLWRTRKENGGRRYWIVKRDVPA
jgi:hypothetical protein